MLSDRIERPRCAAAAIELQTTDLSGGRFLSTLLMAALVALFCMLSQPAGSAETESGTSRGYDIPTGTLAQALNQFAQQAGITLSFTPAQVEGKQSPGLQGSYSVEQALQRLLSGTGLGVMRGTGDSYVVQAMPESSNEIFLPTVTVEGQKGPAVAQATGTVEEGYRNREVSRVGPWQGRELQDTPYSVTVIPRELIENLQATTPEQIYRIVPTAQIGEPSTRNDEPSINLRGFQVYIPYRDGVQGDWIGLSTTTEDVESVEIFSGLSGFLYGPGNVGGMINYVSKRPTAERLNRVTLGNNGGSNYYAQGDFGGPIDSAGRFGYRINGVLQGGETAIDEEDIKKRLISGAFDWHITDTLLWRFDAAYREYETFGAPPVWVLAGGARPAADDIDAAVSWSQPWKHSLSEMQRYGTQLRWDANDALTLRTAWQYSYTRRDRNEGVLNFIQPDGTYTQIVRNQYAPGDNTFAGDLASLSGQAFADIRFETAAIGHKLTTGMLYQKIESNDFTNNAPNVVYTGLTLDSPTYFDRPVVASTGRGLRVQDTDQVNTTLLVGDDMAFDERWSLLAGIAYSTIDVRPSFFDPAGYKKSAATPNLSLVFKPVEAVTTYATYIEALEPGGIAGDDFNGLAVVNAGAVMKPLTSDQIEIGAKWSVGGMLLTTALFQIDKALQYYDLSDPAAVRFVQDGRQVHRGIEFTGFGKVTNDLILTGGITLLNAEVEEQKEDPTLEGKQPSNVAERFAKLRAEYRLPALPALSLIGGVSYTGPQYGDALNTDRLPGFTLFDAGARYETGVGQHPLTLRLNVNNVTDKAYWNQGITLGTPRTVLFSASTEF
jgi:iron complex outermembrane receptor protein